MTTAVKDCITERDCGGVRICPVAHSIAALAGSKGDLQGFPIQRTAESDPVVAGETRNSELRTFQVFWRSVTGDEAFAIRGDIDAPEWLGPKHANVCRGRNVVKRLGVAADFTRSIGAGRN